jgi:glycosyltransferase involved in cell wall biosynthesis
MTLPFASADELRAPARANELPEDVIFLFKRGRRERLDADAAGPTEFFYGYAELKDAGASVDLVDERAFGFGGRMPPGWAVLSRISTAVFGIHAWAVHRLARGLDRLSPAGTVVAVNNAYGVALAYLKARGRLRPGVVFLAMGLVDGTPRPLVRRAYARILRHVTLAAISRPEREHLAAVLPGVSVHYVPFGVDHRFWTPEGAGDNGDYVLSVGNDPHRDYDTLIRAWRPDFPDLRIVTRLPVPAQPSSNVEVIAGDWRTQRLSDAALRDLVRGSRFIVVPVRDTLQPSGQSACLQAMACGKAVVLSDIAGLWDRGLMRDGENCILVPPGDAEALGQAVQRLLDNPDRAQAIGRAARRTVEEHLNVDAMAWAMRELCLEAQVRAGAP